ncbi:MAG: hypothetical protein IJ233_01045 [Pyramidobacter sp.]|nr:hypothetical protein [Pyramidobacter sp.]
MRGRWRWFLFSFLAGSALCLYERCQPLHLKALRLNHFSAEAELALREWSDSFLSFHPAWLLAKKDLRALEKHYPLTVSPEWAPLRGELTLTAVPFAPSIKLNWRHADYLVGADGTAWRSELWTRALDVEIPELPVLNVGSSFPLLAESEQNASQRLKVPYTWLANLWTAMHSLKEARLSDLELARRGGEDIVTCTFAPVRGKGRFSFIGLVSGLEKSLIVVRKLIREEPDQKIAIDATYEDKIIIRRESAPETESS